MEQRINPTVLNMLYLASCALNSYVPDLQAMPDLDLKRIFHFCCFHSMTSIVYLALNSCGAFNDPADKELAKQWKIATAMACHREILFDEERAEITVFMEKNGIKYLPLKGILLKELYPAAGMRQMADNDILFDETRSDDVLKFMKSRGYKAKFEKNGIHGVYTKEPSYNFELHTALFTKSRGQAWYDLSNYIKRKMTENESGCACRLSDEDFYIYMTAHEYRHYVTSGTGLRSLMDCFVFISSKGETLDRAYVDSWNRALGTVEFEKQRRALAMKLFSDPAHFYEIQLTEPECEMLNYYAACGTHGSPENKLRNRLREMQNDGGEITTETKRKFFLKKLFPGMNFYKENYPFVYRHKWTIPFFLVYRFFRTLFTRGKSAFREVKYLFSKNLH